MTKKLTAQIEEDGVVVDLQLDTHFLEFYKKETGHTIVTKKGVTRFLKKLITNFKECCF